MKRIEFIAPVESMRGNLSGNQVLEYAENNNPAFEAPAGVQYARNYQPRFIGAKRSATGKKYFQIKTKSATRINAGTKLKMALLGGTGAVRAAILSNAVNRGLVEAVYTAAKAAGQTSAKTLEKFAYDVIYEGLQNKSIMFVFSAPGASSVAFHNPWVYAGQQGGIGVTIKTTILVKFWSELAINPITFTADGLKGIAHSGDTFSQDFLNSNLNVIPLGFATVAGVANPAVCIKNWTGSEILDEYQVLKKNGAYIQQGAAIEAGVYEVETVAHDS